MFIYARLYSLMRKKCFFFHNDCLKIDCPRKCWTENLSVGFYYFFSYLKKILLVFSLSWQFINVIIQLASLISIIVCLVTIVVCVFVMLYLMYLLVENFLHLDLHCFSLTPGRNFPRKIHFLLHIWNCFFRGPRSLLWLNLGNMETPEENLLLLIATSIQRITKNRYL